MALRYLTQLEIAFARPVFRNSLPWARIQLTDKVGLGGRPYTWGRTINVDRTHFKEMDKSTGGRPLLIHELVHVWQHEHGAHPSGYIFGSLAAQMQHGSAAYNYQPGRKWGDYNPEQQAKIVEDWYFQGQQQSGPLFPYVRDHIWKEKMAADDKNEFPSTF